MQRRSLLPLAAALPLSLLPSARLVARVMSPLERVRPGDPYWPTPAQWDELKSAVGGTLLEPHALFAPCAAEAASAACTDAAQNLRNPFWIGDQPGGTQVSGWLDAWAPAPSARAVRVRNAQDAAAAVSFARTHNLRVVVKGGAHSYLGTSNAPDSLLIWTRSLNDVRLLEDFVAEGCAGRMAPTAPVCLGAGVMWIDAYSAATTRAGRYVQGGGCASVGVAGLVQSGGFGSFSKGFGTAAAGLLEAEVVTADGRVRLANACTNPDLFWALKGGGGGTFGVATKVTLRVHELPEYAGGAIFRVKASSDEAFRRLLRYFVGFYRENLFNDHWGEQAHIGPDNVLGLSMVSLGPSTEEARKVWQPFLDWIARSPGVYTVEPGMILGSMPARHWWDVGWRKEQHQHVFDSDARPGASENNVWWTGDGGQVAWTIYGFESLWLPASLLGDDLQEQLANALFAGSRYELIELHFNKGLAGAPREAIEAARDTATNPAVLNAFALAIVADGEGGYPGVRGHEPNVEAARKSRERVHACMNELRILAPNGGSYVSESNFFEKDWQHSYWGSNYPRLASVKKKYDPTGLFFGHNGVGSEEWSGGGFTKT